MFLNKARAKIDMLLKIYLMKIAREESINKSSACTSSVNYDSYTNKCERNTVAHEIIFLFNENIR